MWQPHFVFLSDNNNNEWKRYTRHVIGTQEKVLLEVNEIFTAEPLICATSRVSQSHVHN